jgi:hypothetical protein
MSLDVGALMGSCLELRGCQAAPGCEDWLVVTVPVYVPSYGMSGETHVLAVGDQVEWELAVIDLYLPDHLLHTFSAHAEPAEPPYPASDYLPTLVREGGFVAWWDPGQAVGDEVELRPVCAIGDSRLPDEAIPQARGTVERLFWALDLLRQRSGGPWDSAPGIGLVEVASTEVVPDQPSFPAYFPTATSPTDGSWRHIGWIAMLRCD